MKHVEIFTDGSCWPNPGGRGGYGVIVTYNEHFKEFSGGYCPTTNNRMEMMAAIVGLEALKEPCQVTLYSDSQYLIKTMNRQFRRGANKDLWNRMDKAVGQHKVKWVWVRGHNGHAENERCDRLASDAMHSKDLLKDEGYGSKR